MTSRHSTIPGADPTSAPGRTTQPQRRRGTLAIAIVALVFAVLIVGTGIGLARADDAPSAPGDGPTDKIGVLTISHVTTDGTPVENSVIQFERVNNTTTTTPSATTTDPSPTTTPPTSPAVESSTRTEDPSGASTPASQPASVRLPVGSTFDLITGKEPIVLAVPEGDYTLTQLGVVTTGTNSETGPTADKVTVHVTAGKQVDGKLTDRTPTNPSTSTEPAPGN